MKRKLLNYTRKCIVDRKAYPVSELVRFVYRDGKLIFDPFFDPKIGGRGSYVLLDYDKINLAITKKKFNYTYKANIPIFAYQNLAIEVDLWWKNRKKESQIQEKSNPN
ncbi:YlxR family protein [Mycoplasma sp. 'Moose RK']|uniref:YlxR family protein n=1 Tax=Mycoplasma sp. 'Moose RK' TaxID=2780095 RepID=UPI0018C2803A|nr:DUF448 domain-containing protein [Mycoplasma sp. 'Moose RK']MBG0731074.1 DUF448 domain-containing protein [Mycoplasma sp. 'Moose RK']